MMTGRRAVGVGGLREYEEEPDDAALPSKYKRQHIGELIRLAQPKGMVVTSSGGGRYTLSDERGHIIWRDGTYGEVEHVIKYGSYIRKGTANAHR